MTDVITAAKVTYKVAQVGALNRRGKHEPLAWKLTKTTIVHGVESGFTTVAHFDDEREAEQFAKVLDDLYRRGDFD